MSLDDLVTNNTATVKVGDKEQEVHGLTLEDLAHLIQGYQLEIEKLVNDKDTSMKTMLSESPTFCAALIAYACNEPDNLTAAAALPAGIQIKMLEAIWILTAIDIDELGKMIVRLLEGVNTLVPTIGAINLQKELST